MHHKHEIDNESGEKMKPEITIFYNNTKGGAVIVDLMCAAYSVDRLTRWLSLAYVLISCNVECCWDKCTSYI